jgi:hypothetical protein
MGLVDEGMPVGIERKEKGIHLKTILKSNEMFQLVDK